MIPKRLLSSHHQFLERARCQGFALHYYYHSWSRKRITFILCNHTRNFSFHRKLAKKVQSSLASANIIAEETISTMKTVRSFANEEEERRSYKSKLDVSYHLRKKEAVAYGWLQDFKLCGYLKKNRVNFVTDHYLSVITSFRVKYHCHWRLYQMRENRPQKSTLNEDFNGIPKDTLNCHVLNKDDCHVYMQKCTLLAVRTLTC